MKKVSRIGPSWASISTRQNRIAVALFSVSILCPLIYNAVPDPWWYEWYWTASSVRSLSLFSAVAILIPYSQRAWKAAFFILTLVSALSAFFNILRAPTEWTLALNCTVWLLSAWSLARMATMQGQPGVDKIDPSKSYLVKVPMHSWKGLVQAVFMPRYHAVYETRCVYSDRTLWLIRKGRFEAKSIAPEDLPANGDYIELPGPLTKPQFQALYNLRGKRTILGFRDCRRFEKICSH